VGGESPAPLGLAQFLRGEASIGDVVHEGLLPNLSIIPRGESPRNPTELLHSKAMNELLEWGLVNGYHVILDCPPILPVADTAVIASKVDGVLLVVSAWETTREACRSAVQRMTFAGGKVLGIVMQKATVEPSPYYASIHERTD
jgi:capsular exopolysaccharide synthesis family protein